MAKQGLFVGLTSLDLIYLTDHMPASNEKRVALEATSTPGGPATNAAITFQHLDQQDAGQPDGTKTQVFSALGQHPLAQTLRQDLAGYGIQHTDLAPQQTTSPPVSSILVTQATGDRAVISLNAVKQQGQLNTTGTAISNLLRDIDVVLVDGHQMAVGAKLAAVAKQQGIPVVVDAGSWKPGFETVLPQATYVIASANFHPPGCESEAAVLDYLQALGIPYIAVTKGADPIQWCMVDAQGEIAVPPVTVVDTLGAGDIFHGAFCHYILQPPFSFSNALAQAAQVAAIACQYFGPRVWMDNHLDDH